MKQSKLHELLVEDINTKIMKKTSGFYVVVMVAIFRRHISLYFVSPVENLINAEINSAVVTWIWLSLSSATI